MNDNGIDGGLVEFAKGLTRIYEKEGTLGGMEEFFTDNGEKVIAAIEGRTETTDTKVVEEKNDTEVLNKGSESDTLKETVSEEDDNLEQQRKDLYSQLDDIGTLLDEMSEQGVDEAEIGKTEQLYEETLDEIKRVESEIRESKKNKSKALVKETSVEREDNGNEQIRGSILSENGGRSSNESTRKQTGKLSEFKRKNKGKNVSERKRISREIIRNGQVEKVENENHKYSLVKPEAYNDEMLSVVEEAKANGKEVGFFVGTATIHPGTANEFQADGIKISSTKILLQYDGVDSSQLMYKHEHIHTEWNSEEVQEISNTMDESLSAEEKQAIYEQERYAHYKEDIRWRFRCVWQEIVCDTMSGMNDYTEKYIDTVNDYWYGDESVEGYNAADYSTSTDAGGERYSLSKDERGEYDERNDNSRGISGISEKSGDKRGRNSSDKRGSLRPIRQVSVSEDIEKQTELHGESSENSARGGREGLENHAKSALGMGREGKSGSEHYDRRFAEAIRDNDESLARDLLDEQASKNGYVPVTLYRGEKSKSVKTSFKDKDIVWVLFRKRKGNCKR